MSMRKFATTHDLDRVYDTLGRMHAENAALQNLLNGPEATARRLEVHELAGRSARRLFEASKREPDADKKQRLLDMANRVLRGEVV